MNGLRISTHALERYAQIYGPEYSTREILKQEVNRARELPAGIVSGVLARGSAKCKDRYFLDDPKRGIFVVVPKADGDLVVTYLRLSQEQRKFFLSKALTEPSNVTEPRSVAPDLAVAPDMWKRLAQSGSTKRVPLEILYQLGYINDRTNLGVYALSYFMGGELLPNSGVYLVSASRGEVIAFYSMPKSTREILRLCTEWLETAKSKDHGWFTKRVSRYLSKQVIRLLKQKTGYSYRVPEVEVFGAEPREALKLQVEMLHDFKQASFRLERDDSPRFSGGKYTLIPQETGWRIIVGNAAQATG